MGDPSSASRGRDNRGRPPFDSWALSESDDCPEGGDGSEDCPYELDEISATVCENEEQTYDEETDECYCENGSDEPDCYLGEEKEPSDPDPDDDCDFEPCGSWDPDDPNECDPSVEICECGDERDVMIEEYEQFSVNLSPTCADFTQTARSVYFSHSELSVNNPHTWSIIRDALIASSSAGYGSDRWRELYGAPRIVESGYRPPAYNDEVDGAPQSRHMYGDALDLRVESRTQAEAEAMEDAAEAANAGFFYIGISSIDGNPGWVHADWRSH